MSTSGRRFRLGRFLLALVLLAPPLGVLVGAAGVFVFDVSTDAGVLAFWLFVLTLSALTAFGLIRLARG